MCLVHIFSYCCNIHYQEALWELLLCASACSGEWSEAHGGCRADILPTSYQSTHLGDAEEVQQRKASDFQHLPVLS